MIIGNPLRWVVNHRWVGNEAQAAQGTEKDRADERRKEAVDSARSSRAYMSRAPCVEAALDLAACTEVMLWDNDFSTWTVEQADAEAAREEAEMEAAQAQGGGCNGNDDAQGRGGGAGGGRRPDPFSTGAAERR